MVGTTGMVLSTCCAMVMAQPARRPADDFVEVMGRALPTAGFVEFTVERPDPPSVQSIGYDLQSRWWYEYRFGTASFYAGGSAPTIVYSDMPPNQQFAGRPVNNYIERIALPTAWLLRVAEQPASVLSATHTDDGAIVLDVYAPEGEPLAASDAAAAASAGAVYRIEVGAGGRVVDITQPDQTFQTIVVGHVGPGLPILAVAPGEWRLVSARFIENADPRVWMNEAYVQKVAQSARKREFELKRERAVGGGPAGSRSEGLTFGDVFPRNVTSRWRGAIVLAGVLLVMFGCWFWWRARR